MSRLLGTISKKLSRKGLYEFLGREYAVIPRGARVLTIGAGGEVNELLEGYARKGGFTVTSFDIDAARDPDIVGDICEFEFGDRQFDVVVMSEVLEHVRAPHLALQNVHKALKKGGRLILSAPFVLPIHDRPHDYYRYTRHGLVYLLRDFQDVQVRERNSYFEAIDVLWVRLRQANVKTGRWLSRIVIPLVVIRTPLTRLLSAIVKTDAMTTGYVVTASKR